MFSTIGLNPQMRGQQLPERERIVRGIALGHEQPEHALRPERARAQRRHDRAVDPAREAEHSALAAQLTEHLLADGGFNLCGDLQGVDLEHGARKHRCGRC